MKRKIAFLTLSLLGSVVIFFAGSTFGFASADAEPNGCGSTWWCSPIENPNTHKMENFKTLGLNEDPWYECCAESCPEADKGHKEGNVE